jgi:hypothetical protein
VRARGGLVEVDDPGGKEGRSRVGSLLEDVQVVLVIEVGRVVRAVDRNVDGQVSQPEGLPVGRELEDEPPTEAGDAA